MKNILLLASKSSSRALLLDNAKIPYQLVSQDADETKCDWQLSLQKVVESIAIFKMEHAILPQGSPGKICYVLTADTLSQDVKGVIHGKPENEQDAMAKIKAAAQGPNICATAFCLERKIFKDGSWKAEKRILKFVEAKYEFIVPDDWIERYLLYGGGQDTAGAIRIEGYGSQFLRMVHGSYSAIVGLPMFELREALQELGFFSE